MLSMFLPIMWAVWVKSYFGGWYSFRGGKYSSWCWCTVRISLGGGGLDTWSGGRYSSWCEWWTATGCGSGGRYWSWPWWDEGDWKGQIYSLMHSVLDVHHPHYPAFIKCAAISYCDYFIAKTRGFHKQLQFDSLHNVFLMLICFCLLRKANSLKENSSKT